MPPAGSKIATKSGSSPLPFFSLLRQHLPYFCIFFLLFYTYSIKLYAYSTFFLPIAKIWVTLVEYKRQERKSAFFLPFSFLWDNISPFLYFLYTILQFVLFHSFYCSFFPHLLPLSLPQRRFSHPPNSPPTSECRPRATKKEGPASLPVPLLKSCSQDCASVKSLSLRPAR